MDSPHNPPKERIKALLIDDDETVQDLLVHFLESACEVDYAINSKTALSLVTSKVYEIIFLDINLGHDNMDGLMLLYRIRELPAYRKVPVIALTAYAMSGDKEEFLSAGCDYYISKPFSRADLDAALRFAALHAGSGSFAKE